MSDVFLPHLIKNPIFKCTNNDNHVNDTCSLILTKFIRPYIKNFEAKCTENFINKHKLNSKTISRKILKV